MPVLPRAALRTSSRYTAWLFIRCHSCSAAFFRNTVLSPLAAPPRATASGPATIAATVPERPNDVIGVNGADCSCAALVLYDCSAAATRGCNGGLALGAGCAARLVPPTLTVPAVRWASQPSALLWRHRIRSGEDDLPARSKVGENAGSQVPWADRRPCRYVREVCGIAQQSQLRSATYKIAAFTAVQQENTLHSYR